MTNQEITDMNASKPRTALGTAPAWTISEMMSSLSPGPPACMRTLIIQGSLMISLDWTHGRARNAVIYPRSYGSNLFRLASFFGAWLRCHRRWLCRDELGGGHPRQ